MIIQDSSKYTLVNRNIINYMMIPRENGFNKKRKNKYIHLDKEEFMISNMQLKNTNTKKTNILIKSGTK